MSLQAVWLYLSNDIPANVTTTAWSVYNLNTDIFSSASAVPAYCYQSLGQILIGSSAASSDLATHVVYQEGQALEQSLSEILLHGSPYESVDLPHEGFFSNDIGAETMRMDIYFRLPEESEDWNTLMNAELRVRYLLDAVWRRKRKSTSSYIPNLGDPSVVGPIYAYWEHHPKPPNAKEIVSTYCLAYTRAVPR